MAQIFEVSPNALNVPDIDTDIGLMHTLFTLEDTRGLKIGKLDGELCLRLDKDAGMTYHSMWDMFNTWYQQADEYSCVGVPLFRRNGYRQSGGRKPLFRNRDTALN